MAEPKPDPSKPLILHVDDDAANRYAVTRSLVKAGFEVIEAGTGVEALEKASARPDLVILDVRLPDIDGFEVCRRLKADAATASTPVLHLSASYVTGQAKAQGLNGGADAYLIRPVEPVELIATVNALLRARRSEEALRLSEERYRRLIEDIKDYGIFLIGPDGRVTSWNAGAQRILGYSDSEVLGHSAAILFTPEDRAVGVPDREMAIATAEGRASNVRWHLRKGGERIFIDGVMTALRDDDGQVIGFSKLMRDVTSRHAADQALTEARRHVDSALLAAEIGTYHWDVAADRMYGDANFARLFGITVDPAAPLPLGVYLAAIHPTDRPGTTQKIQRTLAEDGAFEAEYRILREGGGVRWVTSRGRLERDSAGKPARFSGVIVDVTGHRRAEEALRQSETRLQVALRGGRMGTWDLDLATRTLESSATCRANYGRAAEDPFTFDDVIASLLDEDRAGFYETIERVIADGVDFQMEYRVRWPDRSIHWVQVRGSAVTGTDGRVISLSGVSFDVTDRQASDEALRASEQRYRNLFESIDEGFCVIGVLFEPDSTGNPRTVDYRYLEMNPAFERQTGMSNAVGRTARELMPDHESYWFELYGQVALTGEPRRFEHRAESLNRWFDAYAVRVGDPAARRVAVVFNDVSARRTAEEALARQGRFLNAALSGVSDYTYSLDRRGRFQFVSVQMLEMWGLNAEQALGKDFIELGYPPELAERLQRQVRQVFETRQTLSDTTDYTSPGGVFGSYEYTFTPVLNPDGAVEEVAGVSRDMTERRRSEVERERLLQAEQSARAEAERQGRMKDDFLATLSHELRTPLNAIVGWAQILKGSGGDPADLAEGLAVIDRNARAQTQIIEDILDMSRIISGKLRLEVQRVDLAKLVRAGIDTVQPAAEAKGVRLQIVLDPSAGPISGDPDRLHQVFWNLLSNAVKFTPRDGRVQVVLERVNSHVEVSVIDTGEGIDPAFLPFVFDRFRQGDASTTRKHGGLGLGLAIVKQLVELHGGSVRVKSPGKGLGATFVVALPVSLVQAPLLPPELLREQTRAGATSSEPQNALGQLNGVRVLIVDDEPDGRAVVQRLLEECGAVVRSAGSVVEAMARFVEEVPSVLLSDIGMPGEDGYALIRQVRSLPVDQGGRTPAIALTAYARAADRVRVMEAGFQMHLAKPVEPGELVVTVAAIARSGGGQAAPSSGG